MIGEIRQALASDADAIAELHVLSWRGTYRGILPDSYLDGNIVAERRAAWERFFTAPVPGAMAFLALGLAPGSALGAERKPDGFIAFERGHEPGHDAVIENLHVASSARGRGLGRKLMRAAAAHLIGAEADSLCLWVYDDNTAAIDFYRSLGGVIDACGIDPFACADAPHSRIGWHDLPALRDRCAQ